MCKVQSVPYLLGNINTYHSIVLITIQRTKQHTCGLTIEMNDLHFGWSYILGINSWLKSIANNLPNARVKTNKIGSHQVLPLGKVSPIEMS
jgi:hypothetical protein